MLYQVGEICSIAKSEDELFERVTKSLTDVLSETHCGFVLLDARRSCLVPHPSFFAANPISDRSAIPLDKGVIGQVARSGQGQRVGDVRRLADFWRADPATLSELCVPLLISGDVVGVLNVERPVSDAFSEFDEKLVCTIAKLVGETLQRLRTQRELCTNEERHRLLMDSLPAYISYVDNEERYRWVNRTYENWYQRPRAEIVGKSLRELQGDDHYRKMRASVREALSGRAIRCENSFHDSAGNLRIFDTQYVPHHNGAGQVAGFFVLVFDVTAERAALEMVRESESRSRQLFETCGDSVLVLDASGHILSANPTAARMHGYSEVELLGLNIRDLDDLPSAQYAEHRIQRLLAGEKLTFELSHRRKDGTVFPMEVVATRMQRGDQTCILAINRDITERKLIQDALVRSEEQLRFALKAAGQGFYDLDLVTGNAVVSPEYATMIGHDPATFRETNSAWAERIHPDERAKVFGVFESYVRGELPHYEVEFRQRTRDGGWLWTLSIGSIVSRDASGKPLRMLGTHTNIDARKRSQVALADNERLLQLIVEGMFDGILIAELETQRLTFSNSAMCGMLGIAREELLTHRVEDISLIEFLPKTFSLFQSLRHGKPTIINDLKLRRSDGGQLHLDASGSAIELDGRSCALWIFRDVTYRKEQEVALRESEERYRAIFDSAPDAVFLLSAEGEDAGKIVANNEQAERMQGCLPGELLGKNIKELDSAESAAMFPDRLKRVIAGERLSFEVEHIRSNGTAFPVEVTARKIIVGGRQCVLSFDRDITERQLAKAALRSERDRLRQILDALNAFVAVITPDGLVIEANRLPLDLMGISVKEAQGRAFWEIGWLEPSFESQVRAAIAAAGRGNTVRLDIGACFPKIGRREVDAIFSPITDGAGQVQSIVAFGLDITERKLSELNSARLASIVMSSEDAIMSKTLDGVVTSWNESAQKLFGYAETEVLGTSITRLIPPDRLQEESDIFCKIRRGDRVRQFETVRIKKDGTPIDVSATISAIRDATGKIIGASTIIRDISLRKQAEELLRRSEARLSEAQRIAKIGSWELDFSSGDLHWSDEIYRIFEIDPQQFEASYEAFLAIVHPEDRETVNSKYLSSVETREPYDIVHRLLVPGGRIKFIRERCETFYDATGKPLRSAGTSQDITDRIQAEHALRSSEARLQDAHHIACLGAWEYDFGSDRMWWSGEQYKLNGVEPDTPVTQSLFQSLVHPDDRPDFNKVFELLITQGSAETDYRLVRPDGQVRFMHGIASLVRDAEGRPSRMHGTNQDVTERVIAENLRREIDDRLRLVLENIREGFFILDRNWRCIEINRAGAALFGWMPEQLIGRNFLDEFPDALGTGLKTTCSRVMQRGKGETVEEFCEPLSKWLEARVNPFALGVSVFFADITARKQTELETQQLRDALARVNRLGALNELASGLAHELNQPLGGITLDADTAQMLAQDKGTPDLHACLQRIGDQAFRAGEIVRRMRSFVRHDAYQQAPHNINLLIREVLAMLQSQLYHNRVTIELNLAESLPAALVDGIQIQQVLVNLIRNADEAMALNDAVPRVLMIQTELVTNQIHVSVVDSGCGIDATIAKKLFFPFQSTKTTGLGLGLVTCRTIIEAHGGRIDVHPKQGRGTCFHLTIPVAS